MQKIMITMLLLLVGSISLKGQVEPPLVNGWYEISTLDHLRWVSETPSSWDKNFKLMNDINAADTKNWNVGDHDGNSNTPDSAMGWSPIGKGSSYFSGGFNGQGYVIDSLYINRPSQDGIGFFGIVIHGGYGHESNRNIGITNSRVTGRTNVGGLMGVGSASYTSRCFVTGIITGYTNVGGLVGGLGAKSYGWGSVYGSSIETCHFKGFIYGIELVGGLVGGLSNSSVAYSYTQGKIKGKNTIGGIVGRTSPNSGVYWGNGSIGFCIANSEIEGENNTGGICGINDGSLVCSISEGKINGYHNTGGIVGQNSGTVINSYSKSTIEKTDGLSKSFGGICGFNSDGDINTCYSVSSIFCDSLTNIAFMGKDSLQCTYLNNYFDSVSTNQKNDALGAAIGKTTVEMKSQATYTLSLIHI